MQIIKSTTKTYSSFITIPEDRNCFSRITDVETEIQRAELAEVMWHIYRAGMWPAMV